MLEKALVAGGAAALALALYHKLRVKKIYLAGPDVFLPDHIREDIVVRKKAICKKYGMEGLFPMDNTIDSTGLTLQEIGFVIFRANVGLMNKADIVVANLTPFRGPSGDPGTCYEVGYMFASGKTCCVYSNDARPFAQRVLDVDASMGFSQHRAASVADDHNGHHMEKFDLVDNLMMHCSGNDSGGTVAQAAPNAIKPQDMWTDLSMFEQCVKHLAKKYGKMP